MVWEYKVVMATTIEIIRNHLNALGKKGWELVSVERDLLYLKRPKDSVRTVQEQLNDKTS